MKSRANGQEIALSSLEKNSLKFSSRGVVNWWEHARMKVWRERGRKGETEMITYTIRGINDETDTCACCGKTGLKKVVWLDRHEHGMVIDTVAYGVNCAARATRLGGAARIWTLAGTADWKRSQGIVDGAPKCWGVVKLSTGMAILRGLTREDAERTATARGDDYFASAV